MNGDSWRRALLLLALVGVTIGALLAACAKDPVVDDNLDPATVEPTAATGLSGAIPTRTPNANRPTAGYGSQSGLVPEGAVPRISELRPGGVEGSGDLDGLEAARSFVAPLNGWEAILDRWGAERPGGFFHGGIDFGLDSLENSPIYASCSGRVVSIDESPTHSRYIVVRCHQGKWSTVYAHLGDVLVAVDDLVDAGDTILARQGEPTPWGPAMLHFELRWDFVPVDPEAWIDFNVRPLFTILTPTPTATPTSTATPTAFVPPGPGDIPGPDAGELEDPPTPLPTVTPTPTLTPTPTPWLQPTATPVPPTATPTRIPTSTPSPTPQPPGPEPTPTPPLQIF